MKLRMGNTRYYISQQMYRTHAVSDGVQGISTAAAAGGMVELFACTRPLLGPIKEWLGEHCFLKIKDINTRVVIGSISFGQNGGLNEDVRVHHESKQTCAYVDTITWQQWNAIKAVYAACGQRGYHLFTHNCCTCTQDALVQNNLPVPAIVTEANFGQGTDRRRCAIL